MATCRVTTNWKSIKVYSIDTVPLGNYSRSGTSRYGTPIDLTDSYQTMVMTQDKAFTLRCRVA